MDESLALGPRYDCHIPDQILIACQTYYTLKGRVSLPYLSALCLLHREMEVNSREFGALLRLRIRGRSDVQKRGRTAHNTVVILLPFVFIFICPLCQLKFILNNQSWCV